jgi:predicted nuclease of predicted toxin-antitoxin system
VIIWIDAQLFPGLARWMTERFGVKAFSAKHLGYRDATDSAIFEAARDVGAVVMTKDGDFVRLLHDRGPPPQILWIRLGNTSNARMRSALETSFERAMALLQNGEDLVEIRDIAPAPAETSAAEQPVAADDAGAARRPRR